MNPLERAALRSPAAALGVGLKLAVLLPVLLGLLLLPPAPGLPLGAALVGALTLAARPPLRLWLVLLSGPALFAALSIWPLIFGLRIAGGPQLYLLPGGLQYALVISARSLIGSAAVVLFALTTPLPQLLSWLVRRGLSPALALLIQHTYVLSVELMLTARAMYRAQAGRLGHTSRRRQLHSAAAHISTLFIVALDRARRRGEGLALRADAAAQFTYIPPQPAPRAAHNSESNDGTAGTSHE